MSSRRGGLSGVWTGGLVRANTGGVVLGSLLGSDKGMELVVRKKMVI